MVNPYTEVVNGNTKIRTFDGKLNEEELVWHRDRNARKVTILESNGWKFQYDNGIPMLLEDNDVLYIPKEMYHRVIKGTGPLVIEIEEL